MEALGLAFTRTAVRIYMYELPWNVLHQPSAFGEWDPWNPPLYAVEDQFRRWLISDRKVSIDDSPVQERSVTVNRAPDRGGLHTPAG